MAPRVIQQVEIVQRPVVIEEHRGEAYWCRRCRKIHTAPLPAEVERAGLTGPTLTALVGYMKGACHASFSTIRKFLRDVVGFTISRGQLAKILGKVSDALAGPYEDLLRSLPSEATVNVDETGHRENGAGSGLGVSGRICTCSSGSTSLAAPMCSSTYWGKNSTA